MSEKLPLSKQELKVLEVLSTGKLYKEIALDMEISINTVKKHLKNIYRKLEVTNRKHAAVSLKEKTADVQEFKEQLYQYNSNNIPVSA